VGTVATGAAPRLSGAGDYSTWATLFLNWLKRNGLDGALKREIPRLEALFKAVEKWEQEEQDASFSAALASVGKSSFSSSSTPVKKEDAEAEALAKKAEMDTRRVTIQVVALSKRVYSILFECLPEELRAQVPTPPDDAFALWRWLEKKFQSTEADNVGALWKQWSSLSMEEDESFDAYRARVVE
jgi:hypothetical protein